MRMGIENEGEEWDQEQCIRNEDEAEAEELDKELGVRLGMGIRNEEFRMRIGNDD